MKNDKREEAISDLYNWAKEDINLRCMLVVTLDEKGSRTIYACNSRGRLVDALTASMLKDEEVKEICTQALAEVDAVVNSED